VHDSRLGVQFDEAEARTLQLVYDVPLAVVVHEGTVSPFWSKRGQGLWADLSAVTAHASILRRHSDRVKATTRKFYVHVMPAVVQHVDTSESTEKKAFERFLENRWLELR
jgi:hypothetical protein